MGIVSPSDPATLSHSSGPSAVRLYWLTVLLLAIGTLLLFALLGEGEADLFIAIFLLVLALPGVQLAAALLTALLLAVSAPRDKSDQFRQLGKIVLGVVAGAGVGILLMLALGWGDLILTFL